MHLLIHLYSCIYSYIYIHAFTHTFIFMHLLIHLYLCIYSYIYIHAFTHTFIFMHLHTRMLTHRSVRHHRVPFIFMRLLIHLHSCIYIRECSHTALSGTIEYHSWLCRRGSLPITYSLGLDSSTPGGKTTRLARAPNSDTTER